MLRIIVLLSLFTSTAFCEWKDLKKDLRTLMRSGNIYTIQKKLEQISQYDNEEAADYLIDLIKSRRTHSLLKMTSSRVLSGFKSDEARKLIAKEALGSSAGVHVTQALLSTLDEFCQKTCEELVMRSNDAQKLTLAIRTLGKFKVHKAEIIKKMLTRLDPRRNPTSVRRAVCEALGSVKNPEVAPYLVLQMKDKAVGPFAIDSLERLTGQRFGNDPGSWKKWLGANKAFTPVNMPLEKYQEEKRNKQAAAKAEMKEHGSAEFYGVEIQGENILFVLDRSGSMSAKTEYGTRLDHLKKEFIDMVDALEYKKRIGVLWFPGNETYPRTGVDEVTDTFKSRLKKYMQGIREGGGTPIGEAMTHAYKEIVEKRKIDSIYLLSDGAPSSPPEEVRKLIKNLNASHFVKISTISIGASSDFLKKVAEDNYGTYTEIK